MIKTTHFIKVEVEKDCLGIVDSSILRWAKEDVRNEATRWAGAAYRDSLLQWRFYDDNKLRVWYEGPAPKVEKMQREIEQIRAARDRQAETISEQGRENYQQGIHLDQKDRRIARLEEEASGMRDLAAQRLIRISTLGSELVQARESLLKAPAEQLVDRINEAQPKPDPFAGLNLTSRQKEEKGVYLPYTIPARENGPGFSARPEETGEVFIPLDLLDDLVNEENTALERQEEAALKAALLVKEEPFAEGWTGTELAREFLRHLCNQLPS